MATIRTFSGRRQLRAGVRNEDLDHNFAHVGAAIVGQELGDHSDTTFTDVATGDLIKKGSGGDPTYTGGDGAVWAPVTGTTQTLTNGDLTAEDESGTWPKVYSSTTPKTGGGKYAWEVTLDSDIGTRTENDNLVGFTTAQNAVFIGGNNTYSRVVTNAGKLFYNSIVSAVDADREWYTVGATLMCLLDLDAGEFSIISSKHGVEKLCWSGLNTALNYWALLSQRGDNGGTGTIVTVNFGASAFVNTLPAGYARFDGTTETLPASDWVNFTPTYISNVVEDTTPELGADLDAGAFDITNLTEVVFSGGESIIGSDVTNWDENLSTGIVAGGMLSVNGGDNTKFDVSAGSGIVVDHSTNPPTITPVAWGAFSAQTVTNLATSFATDVAINAAGAIVQQDSFTNEELRSLIFLGGLDHSNQTSILSTFPIVRPTAGAASGIAELADALGELNTSGNAYNANVAGNLTIDKSAGTTYSYGRNFQANEDAPSTLSSAADTVVSFGRVFNNGSGTASFTAPGTNIDPNFYDDGSGTLAPVKASEWTIQRILFFPNSDKTFVQYGTVEYNKLIDALDAVPQAPFLELAGIRTASTRGYLIVKDGETDLTSPDTIFLNANKYGFVAGQDAGSSQAAWGNITGTLADQTDLQNALDTASTEATWGSVTGTLSDQTDLQAALDAGTAQATWGSVSGTLSNQTDLQAALDAGSAEATWGQITGTLSTQTDLQTELNTASTEATWGNVTGTLSSQTDLQAALDAGTAQATWGSVSGTLASQTDLQTELNTASTEATWGNVTGTLASQIDLQAALDAGTAQAVWGSVSGTLASQTDLQTALNTAGDEAVWGNVTGTLSSQTDLQSALDAKVNLAGDTMTGDLTMDGTSNINLEPAAGVTDGLDWTFETGNLFSANTLKISTPGTATTMSSGIFMETYAAGTAYSVSISSGYLSLPRDPTNGTHAVNKDYADTMVPLAGGTMTGDLTLSEIGATDISNSLILDHGTATLHGGGFGMYAADFAGFGTAGLLVIEPVAACTAGESAQVQVRTDNAGTTYTFQFANDQFNLPAAPTGDASAVRLDYIEGSRHVANGKLVCNGTTSPTVHYSNGCSISVTAAGVITVTLDSALGNVHHMNVQVSGVRAGSPTIATHFTAYPTTSSVFTIRGFNQAGTLVSSPTVMFVVTDMTKF